ncbi:hypothetical protein JL720_11656 [Aureococcus anophagefferens]|nr:hypothetical protein JL720_11656 [Aureococcus anophagefferens]
MLQSLLKAAGGLATLSVAVFASLVGALYHFQRNLIFPRPDNSNPLPIRKGQLVTVDVSREARPEGVPGQLVAAYFPPTTSKHVLAFWHGNADQIGNVGDHLGHPTEETIVWAAERMLKHLHVKLEVPWETTVAFGQSIGGSVALQMTAKGLAGKCVLLSSFSSIPKMAKTLFPFVPSPELLVKDPFDNAAIAPSVKAPVLCLHGTRDEIVPYSQGEEIASLLPNSRFVPLRGAGHNDTFNGAHFREVINTLADFLNKV